ncbi:MAG: proteasome assembly chaperone family protein [Candidatus Diapherotrites archaeon]|nr:proteasome assembly chaperone family protein [Candidatus Diapherotrites archaeon]
MAVLKLSKPFKDSIVVVAFPGLGYVGTISGRYVVDKLKLQWSGYLHDEGLPPVGKVKNGSLYYPINVFSGENFHLVLSEVAVPEDKAWDIAKAIVSRARKDGARYLVILSGVLIGSSEGVYAIPSGKRAERLAQKFGFKPIENGVVAGVSAAILLLSRELGIPALLLLGPAKNPQDFEASLRVVEALGKILNVDIPTDELVELSHRYEHEINLLKRKTQSEVPMYG